MADLEFFFDPVCPFAWVTSRWVKEVQAQREYDVTWRFISLAIINEDRTSDWYTPEYRAGHVTGMMGLRVADELRQTVGNDGVDRLYTALGTAFHNERRRQEMTDDPIAFLEPLLKGIDLDPQLAQHALDESHDAYLRKETELAFSRTGPDVGTPILTFNPGSEREASFFGPVISKTPRGEEATRLWDAVRVLAETPSMSELKRSARAKLDFS
jgi:hypothetical protein